MLLALFPWVEDAFYERFKEKRQASDSVLQLQLARLEELLIEQGSVPMEAQSTGPRQLAITTALPQMDEEIDGGLLIIKQAASNGASTQNFLNSAFNLVQ